MGAKEHLLRRLEDQRLMDLGATPELLHAVRAKDVPAIEEERGQLRLYPQLPGACNCR